MVGELVFTVLKNQFEALRDGDRYWYQRALPPAELAAVEGTRLADIIRRNTVIGGRDRRRRVYRSHTAAASRTAAPSLTTAS